MELLDVLDDQGLKTGEIKSKEEIHRDGDWHKTIHVHILNSRNQLLLQRRSSNQESDPNMWDVSVAGHVDAGEESINAAIREAREEIGITINPEDLEFLFTVQQQRVLKEGTYLDNKFDDIYLLRRDLDVSELTYEDKEVAETKWITVTEFAQWVQDEKPDLVVNPAEYQLLLVRLSS